MGPEHFPLALDNADFDEVVQDVRDIVRTHWQATTKPL